MSDLPIDSQSPQVQPQWSIELLMLPSGQIPYETFRNSLDPYEKELLDLSIEMILGRQGNNVCETTWGKSLGAGLYEFRINRSLSALFSDLGIGAKDHLRSRESKLFRVFFAVEGAKVILLLSGYNKGKDPSRKKQQKLIKTARAYLKQHKKGI